MRALTALGIEPGVIHLNEGHAMLAPVELACQGLTRVEDAGRGLAAARERTVFTTHTPVPAGNDTYPRRAGRARDREPARAQLGCAVES